MNIGFINFFPFRPFVSNTYFLSKQLENHGHSVYYLDCDGTPKVCHNLLIKKDTNKILECIRCKSGGLSSFDARTETIKRYSERKYMPDKADVRKWVLSTRATAFRSETMLQMESELFMIDEHIESTSLIFSSVCEWIEANNIGYLICFNGRMDFTRAAIEAAKFMRIRFLTHDSTWFGNGISISKDNLIITPVQWYKANEMFKEQALSRTQLIEASNIIARRFLKKSYLEWKQYNINSNSINWSQVDSNVTKSKKKILILPSSRAEFLGVEDFDSEWSDDSTVGFEQVIDYLKVNFGEEVSVIVKGHPIWDKKVFGLKGTNASSHYGNWSAKSDYHWISSSDNIDTYSLMKESDIILINGSSAALEGVFFQKPIICICKTFYSNAGFVCSVIKKEELEGISSYLENFNAREGVRYALRFIYTVSSRMPWFLDNIRGVKVTDNRYFEINKYDEIDGLLDNTIERFSEKSTDNSLQKEEEYEFIDALLSGKWEDYLQDKDNGLIKPEEFKVQRRLRYRVVDVLRNAFPKGDEK